MKYFKRNRSRLFNAIVTGRGHGVYCAHALVFVPSECFKDTDTGLTIVHIDYSNLSAIFREIQKKQDRELFRYLFKRGYELVGFNLSITKTDKSRLIFNQFFFKRNKVKKQTSKKKRYYPRRINAWNIIKRDLEKPIS
nr:MAG TPA: hypothetical protein [Caudoviricetes sp.]